MVKITYKTALHNHNQVDGFDQCAADEIECCESPAELVGRLLETLYTKGLLNKEEVGDILDIEIISID